jgi:hypothetical protein
MMRYVSPYLCVQGRKILPLTRAIALGDFLDKHRLVRGLKRRPALRHSGSALEPHAIAGDSINLLLAGLRQRIARLALDAVGDGGNATGRRLGVERFVAEARLLLRFRRLLVELGQALANNLWALDGSGDTASRLRGFHVRFALGL